MYHGTPWYTMVHHGIRTNVTGYDTVAAWHTVVCHCVPWYNMLYFGIICFSFTMVYHSKLW